MPMYISKNTKGDIIACADWKFPASIEVDFEVVRGYDGKLYKAGEEPIEPETYIEPEPIVISSNMITYSDADLLYKASKNGNEIATWLINKLDL